MSDFFIDNSGTAPNFHGRLSRLVGAVVDPLIDVLLLTEGIRAIDSATVPRQVLAVGIEVPSRANDIHRVLGTLQQSSKHSMQISVVPMEEGLGKFANIERALASVDISSFEWLIIVDDDVAFDGRMLDRLIALSELAGLSISQPAHKRSSFATYALTLRKPWSFVRETRFVEIGPLTLLNRRVFSDLIPFPASRWCYGIDLVWSEIARLKGFKMGIVDAAPVRHLRRVGNSYNMERARAEGESLIRPLNIPLTRAELLGFERDTSIFSLKRLARQRMAEAPH